MKKLIPALAVLGSAVAFAVYKMKKDEQKQIMELDQDLLVDDTETESSSVEKTMTEKKPVHEFVRREAPLQEEVSKAVKTVKKEEEKVIHKMGDLGAKATDTLDEWKAKADQAFGYAKEKTNTFMERARDEAEDTVDTAKKIEEDLQDQAVDIRDAIQEAIEEEAYTLPEEPAVSMKKEEPAPSAETYHEEYPHLTNALVDEIKQMTQDAMDSLASDGDVHEHERPVQHMVSFRSSEDLDTFKNKVINKGFVITKGEGELDLVVLHISPVDKVKLVSNILYLADQAYANHGEYRGWQSKVSY